MDEAHWGVPNGGIDSIVIESAAHNSPAPLLNPAKLTRPITATFQVQAAAAHPVSLLPLGRGISSWHSDDCGSLPASRARGAAPTWVLMNGVLSHRVGAAV